VKEFKDRTAVITGAASGIGRAIAERCAREEMKVVLADIDEEALGQAEREMKAAGVSVLSVVTDVSRASDVESLAQKTLAAFGAVHLLCNNAGVGVGGCIWECTLEDWKWVLGVNLWGIIHGVRVFIPIMLEQDTECHIVNTASGAGMISSPHLGIYKVTKHAVITLSETLYHEMALRSSKIKVSVLCPMWVNTRLLEADRNRPAELQNDPDVEMKIKISPEYQKAESLVRDAVLSGMSCPQVADCVFNALRSQQFYILTDPEFVKPLVQLRMEDILQERSPTNPIV
jgi:NAD(P)-dependent dehydrogenase (short-subunit alcohol dehydrogenase family)